MWGLGGRLWGGVAMQCAPFCPFTRPCPIDRCPIDPLLSQCLIRPRDPIVMVTQEASALCQHASHSTSLRSNGFDPTTPCQRKGCLQHPKAARGIPDSPTPTPAIKELWAQPDFKAAEAQVKGGAE